MAKLQYTLGTLQGLAVRSLDHLRKLVDEGEGTLGAGEGGLEITELPADALERAVELSQVCDHHQKHTQR